MVIRSKSICQHPGCSVLIEVSGRCAKHKRVEQQQRGTAHERGYTSAWRKARAAYLRKYPLCVYCDRDGCVTAAEVVDHIIPHQLKPAIDSGNTARIERAKQLFWDSNNWQSLCKRHHDMTKQAEEISGGWR